MDGFVIKWSYRLGFLSALVAVVMRAFNAMGMFLPKVILEGQTIWYMSFYKAALLFLLIAVAPAAKVWVLSRTN